MIDFRAIIISAFKDYLAGVLFLLPVKYGWIIQGISDLAFPLFLVLNAYIGYTIFKKFLLAVLQYIFSDDYHELRAT